jgi:hypothetical protein
MLDVDFALRSDRTMKALTGLSRSEFQQLGPAFDQALSKQMQSRRLDREIRCYLWGAFRMILPQKNGHV